MPLSLPPSPRLRSGHPLARGIIGAWPSFEGSGNMLNDIGPSQITGAKGTAIGTTAFPPWVGTPFGWGLSFSAASKNAVALFPHVAGTSAGVAKDAALVPAKIAICAWVKQSFITNSSFNPILCRDDIDFVTRCWQFRVVGSGSAGQIQFIPFNEAGSNGAATGSTNISDGKWHRVWGTWDGARVNVYVDGKLDGTGAFSGTNISGMAPTSAPPYLGLVARDTSRYYEGLIVDPRIYNRVPAADEIALDLAAFFNEYRPRRLWLKAAAGGGATLAISESIETDTAFPVGRAKALAIGQAIETDSTFAVARAKALAIGQPLETDSAFAAARLKVRAIGLAVATETALPLGSNLSLAIGQAVETDEAFATGRLKAAAIALAIETDQALTAARAKALAIGQPVETDSALALTRLKMAAIGLATETDTAQAVTRLKAAAIGLATEIDTAFALANAVARAAAYFRHYILGRRNR